MIGGNGRGSGLFGLPSGKTIQRELYFMPDCGLSADMAFTFVKKMM